MPEIAQVRTQDNPVTVEPTLAGHETNNSSKRESQPVAAKENLADLIKILSA